MVILAVLLLVCATVTVIIFATGSAAQNSDPAKLDIAATNLSFSDSVYIKYAVTHENVDASEISLLIWTTPQSEYVKGTETAVLANVGYDSEQPEWLIFNYKDLAAKQMTDNVYARAYAEVNGVACYSETKKYSILQYAYNMMGKTGTGTENQKLVALLEDMLGYGALAQKYTGYKTDTLATDPFRQIKLAGGVLEDGFNHGLYKVGTSVTITAPASNEDFSFVGWRNTAGEIVSKDSSATLTVGETNELYTAVYQGNTSDKLEYVVNADGITYSVSGRGDCTDVNIVIPSVVGNKLITGISDGAFKDCDDIKGITVNKNITSIGAEAFSGCSSLNAIYFEGSEYEWNKIEKGINWNSATGEYTLFCTQGNDDWELGGVPLG